MNIKFIVALSCFFLASASIAMQMRNQFLRNDIAAATQSCRYKVSALENTLIGNIQLTQANPALHELVVAHEVASQNTTAEPPTVALDNLISHEHRIQAVTNKYEFLLETAQIDHRNKKALRELLVERERIASQTITNENEPFSDDYDFRLREIETEIEALLTDDLDLYRFEFIKQRHL